MHQVHVHVLSRFHPVQLFVILWTVAHQALLFIGFSRQEYWDGMPFPPPGNLPDLGIESMSLISLVLAGRSLPLEPSGKTFMYPDQISRSVMSDSLWPHELQHARPPCPSPTSGVHSDSRPSSQWCHPAISSSVVPFSSCPNPSQHQSLFQWVNSSCEVAKVLEFQL